MAGEREIVAAILGSRTLTRSGILTVHSSFRHLSRAGLRAEAFCEALIDYMQDGTVLMPTMTWRTVTPENPVFDELKTPSHVGVLTEVFRTKYATHRSLHPTHSVAGRGPLAERLLSTHHEGTTPCAGNSPYGLMRDYTAYVLMIGVGLESCTAFHHAEEMMAPEIYVRPMEQAESYQLVDRRQTVHKVMTRRHYRLPRNFPKFEPRLAAKQEIVRGECLATTWLLFDLRDLYRELFTALVARRDATLHDY